MRLLNLSSWKWHGGTAVGRLPPLWMGSVCAFWELRLRLRSLVFLALLLTPFWRSHRRLDLSPVGWAVWRGAFPSPEPCPECTRPSLVSRMEGSWPRSKGGLSFHCGASRQIHWERQSWVIYHQTYKMCLPTSRLLKCSSLCLECSVFPYLPIESPRVLQVPNTASLDLFSEYFPVAQVFQVPFIIFLQNLYLSF